jgi:hypothetical protein
MKMKNYFMDLFGEFEMDPSDLAELVFRAGWNAELVFRAGWNAALDEANRRAALLPFGKDTQDSFAHWVKEIKE